QWPGYPHVEWYCYVEVNTKMGPNLSRSRCIFRLMDCSAENSVRIRERNWKVGADRIRLENLVILSVWNTYENSWQAEITV
ncbi:hypothetical protein BDZ89DRAFT_925044, partial [Hymenopellis radicata]